MVARTSKKLRTDTAGDQVFVVICYVFVVFLVFVTFYPFWDQFILSISPRNEALRAGFRVYTARPSLEAYQNALGSNEIVRSFGNAVLRVILGTLVSLSLVSLTAYPLSKREMPFARIITFFFLFTMYFGGGLIPTYLLIKDLGLMNRIWALILPGAVSAYNLIVMRSFIDTLPQSLEESARIDGASYFTIWRRIVLPLSKPVLATVTLWVAVGHWNAYFDAMIYMHDRAKYTLPVILRRILLENQLERFLPVGSAALLAQVVPTPETTKAAIVMISTIPIICMYPFVQKYFTKGVLLGAVKG
jgi:putative aldouronate transport system permease protein